MNHWCPLQLKIIRCGTYASKRQAQMLSAHLLRPDSSMSCRLFDDPSKLWLGIGGLGGVCWPESLGRATVAAIAWLGLWGDD